MCHFGILLIFFENFSIIPSDLENSKKKDNIISNCQSKIIISDDGYGMSNEEIIQAMRPGAQNPLEERSLTDLGRFGLGLKTASFSQCRNLTVMCKQEGGAVSYWTWSLDYVAQSDKWELIKWAPDE